MKTTLATYYLRNTRLAQHEMPYTLAFPPNNLAFFCRTCGDIWARITYQGSSSWNCALQACERHLPVGVVDWNIIPGSLMGSLHYPESEGRRLQDFPRTVLLREFEIHAKHFLDRLAESV